MPKSIWIETADAAAAAFLMRDSVGRLTTRLVQCGRRWRVLVAQDRDPARLIDDVVSLVRAWLGENGSRDASVHVDTHTLSLRQQRRRVETATRPARPRVSSPPLG